MIPSTAKMLLEVTTFSNLCAFALLGGGKERILLPFISTWLYGAACSNLSVTALIFCVETHTVERFGAVSAWSRFFTRERTVKKIKNMRECNASIYDPWQVAWRHGVHFNNPQ